ncbi:M23 family metallopeptidase [Micrococcales bacterium 31B]|nr:M23 family metallopeptidase [Micrococcales bacterium 31B]
MTSSSSALKAKYSSKSVLMATAALAGAATLLVPSTATYAAETSTSAAAANSAAEATSVVKVSYSAVLYQTTGTSSTPLTFAQWQQLGFPAPTTVGSIPGTVYFKYGTSPAVLAQAPGQPAHVLTWDQWVTAGMPAPQNKSNEGLIKLSWAPEIARMTNLQTGAGYPMSFQEWANNGFTAPAVQQRIIGDQFYQYAGSPDVWYAGPGVNRKITFAEWVGAGQPTPSVRGTVSATAASNAWGLIKPVNARVTSEFSTARMHPTLGYVRPHLGIDLGAACGVPVQATRGGVVSSSTYDSGGGYSVTINHGIVNGVPLYSSYLHLRQPGLAAGTQVATGTVIGYVGTTGSSTGCHLHFEIKPNNQAQNPRNFLAF